MTGALDRRLAGCQACGLWDRDEDGRLMCCCPPARYAQFHPPQEVEVIIRGPANSGKSTLARLIRAGILERAGLFVEPNQAQDCYPGCGNPLAPATFEADVATLRRLWPHISIRTEDGP